jgi:mannose-1-phosphate guanylyltransferase
MPELGLRIVDREGDVRLRPLQLRLVAVTPDPTNVATADGNVAVLHAIVPAGGAGTRLWPLSRAGRPKFLLDLTGAGRSLLQQTWDRLVPLAGTDGVLVVTGRAHAAAVAEQLDGFPGGNLLAEPSPRDSAAAICLAAAVIRQRHPDAVVGSFAADHVIRDVAGFQDAVRQAVVTAEQGYIVTIGIEPVRPSTAFGYIRMAHPLEIAGAPSACAVGAFVEKPGEATAAAYLAEGCYRWNAGMFVARANVLLDELALRRPELHDGLLKIADAWDTPDRDAVLTEIWPSLEKVAIDYAIAEPAAAAGRVAMVPGQFDWDDVGDFASVSDLLAGEGPLRVLGAVDGVVDLDAGGVAVPGSGRLVALLGVDDLVVVDTPDALLVTTRERAQDVKGIVDHLRRIGRDDLL